MRLTISALLLGAASSAAALPSQFDKSSSSVSDSPFNYKSVDLDFSPAGIKPKKSTRRPASFWDHVVDGAEVQQGTHDGVDRRKVDGELSSYSLRVKANDPSSLGVDKVKQYSGYLDDDKNDKHLFYWFFESRNDPKNDPVVLWLNGGPGCSSMVGLFDELGPAKIPGSNLKPVSNPSSWNNNASVIFLDQPVNVGYSYSGKSVSTTAAASKDVYALLTLFFTQFPQYAKQDFHISGESYAGHYIPIFAAEILSHQNRNINLKSVLIGNGLTDPLTQYNYYRPMACGEGGYPSVLPKSTCDSMDKALPQCEKYIQACYDNPTNAGTCSTATSYCNSNILGPYQRSGRSVYDIRINDGEGAPSYAYQFLNSQKVKDAVGAEVDSYEECNGGINGAFSRAGDWMQPIQKTVPKVLEQIPVLIYAGDADYICNWLGNRAWTNALQWPGSTAFKNAETQSLKFPDSTEYGKVKTAQGLTFIQIYKAGHMVPSDQPKSALDFFNRAIGGEWFKK